MCLKYMRIIVVYFAYLLPGYWQPIVNEQLESFKSCGLYDECDEIYMSVISDDTELTELKNIINTQYPKVHLTNIYTTNVYEYPGIKTVYETASKQESDAVILYFHSKGMTSGISNSRAHDARVMLFKHTIENYKEYIREFSNNSKLDVGAIMPHTGGFAYFNFFWVRASYVKEYCREPEIDESRYIWETWLQTDKKQVITYSTVLKDEQLSGPSEVWPIHDRLIDE